MDDGVVAAQVVGGEVELDVGKGHLVDEHVPAAAGERPQAGEELGCLKGLGHVVVGAGVKALDLIV